MSNGELEAENSTSERSSEPSGEVYPQLSDAPAGEHLLGKLLNLLVWLRTLEENSIATRQKMNRSGPPAAELFLESNAEDLTIEGQEIAWRDILDNLSWVFQGTVDSMSAARKQLIEFLPSSKDKKVRVQLSNVRSRLKGLYDQLGVEIRTDSEGTSAISNEEAFNRASTNWFLPHLHDHIHDFDRARSDLTIAMVENEESGSIDDEKRPTPLLVSNQKTGFQSPGC